MQKEKDEAKQRSESIEKNKLRTERLLEDTSDQVQILISSTNEEP